MERNRRSSSKKDNKEKKSYKKIIITVFLIVISISSSFIVFFVLQIALNTSSPVVVVISESMEPNIYKGDLLFVQGVDEGVNIRNGSIAEQDGHVIVFIARWMGAPTEPVVHRVVNKWDDGGVWKFQTKGDNNPVWDASGFWTSEQDILGVVVGRIPYIGWVKIFLTDSPLIIYLIIGIIIILIISLVWDMTKESKENDSKKKENNAKYYKHYSPDYEN